MTLIEAIGWTGSMMLALSVVPQAVACIRHGHSRGLEWGMLLMWLFGEAAMFAYVIAGSRDPVLLANYTINFSGLMILLYYKVWPR